MSVAELKRETGKAANDLKRSRFRLVDADAHIDPPHTFWREYLPAHLRELGPKIEEGSEHDWVVFEGRRRPLNLLANMGGREGKDFKATGKVADLRQTCTPAARLADMDADGVEAAAMFGGGPLGTLNTELFIESFRAYNRYVADFCAYAPRRLAGIAYLPLRDVEETIRLLREAVRLGLRSVNLPAYPQAPDGVSTSASVKNIQLAQGAALTGDPNSTRAYWHPEFEPLWREICEHDVTVTFHLGGRLPRFGDKAHFLPDLVMSKVAMAEPVAMAIFGGLFDRFPGMRWAIIESGVGWMAWMAEYMDRTWEKQRFWIESKLVNPPSYYMDQNIYASFIRDRVGVSLRNCRGGRNIMWSSDFPHSETTFPNSVELIERDFDGVPFAEAQEILGGRARALFQIG
jgi:predicted TIM-barrel fold metal-dependent hydrolase